MAPVHVLKFTLRYLVCLLLRSTGPVAVTDRRCLCLRFSQGLNELGEKYNLPIEFVDGFIRSVTVTFPWFSPLGENSTVELEGLMMTVQPKQRVEDGN